MISNSLKYAFKDRKSGKISIRFNEFPKKEKKFELIVEDDGVGISKNFDFLNVESFGMQIINSLVSQLDGSIALDNKGGTKFSIQF